MHLPLNVPQRKPPLFSWVAEHKRRDGECLVHSDSWGPGGQSGPATAQEEGSSHLNSPHTRSVRHQPPPGITSQVPERKSRPLWVTGRPVTFLTGRRGPVTIGKAKGKPFMLSLPANGGNQSNTASPRSPQSWASPSDTRKVACDDRVTPPMLSHRQR